MECLIDQMLPFDPEHCPRKMMTLPESPRRRLPSSPEFSPDLLLPVGRGEGAAASLRKPQPPPPLPHPSSPGPPSRTKRRHVIAVLCLWVTTICYADRTNIGIALPAFVQSKEDQGHILAAFFYGYLVTQIPGGFLAAKIGAKRVLLTGVIVWTLFDLSTVVLSKHFTGLFLARVGMGLGEGILFPCMHQIAGAWYPLQERSRLVSFVSGGSDLGTVVAMIVSPALLATYGWPRIFEFFAVLSFLWVAVYALYGASHPDSDPYISREERSFIIANRSSSGTTPAARGYETRGSSSGSMNWKVLLTSRPAWAVYVAHFCHNYGWYVLLGWIPQYFRQVLHIDLGSKGFTAAIPYFCGYLGVLVFGRFGDFLVTRDFRVLRVRQLINGVGFLGSAFFLFTLRYATNATMAVVLLSLTLFLGRASLAGYWVNMIDLSPKHAAHVMAVSNTFATIPGIVGNVVTGHILAVTGRWDLVFAIASGILVFGAVFFHCNASDQSIYSPHLPDYNRDGRPWGNSPGSDGNTIISSSRDEEISLLDN